jgi:dTDP-4-dehydrorhamnose 3,5-epimerase-like enzyme
MQLLLKNKIIAGVSLVQQEVQSDFRGDLIALQAEHLPFELKRVFAINVDDPAVSRGGHANSCHELIVALEGSVTVVCCNGLETSATTLVDPREALWVSPGVVIDLKHFSGRTVLLVCASERYEDTEHFASARPDLIHVGATS